MSQKILAGSLLTDEEIAAVAGGWDSTTAQRYLDQDKAAGWTVGDPSSGSGWVFNNGGSGWGYFSNAMYGQVSDGISYPDDGGGSDLGGS